MFNARPAGVSPEGIGGSLGQERNSGDVGGSPIVLDLRIPDARIRMDYFRTVRQIADTFVTIGDADVAA